MIYLASQSPRRSEILKRLGTNFRVVLSSYRENNLNSADPETLVLKHAYGKVEGACLPKRACFVLGADTLVSYRGHILGKPASMMEAVKMLKKLSGRVHDVFTGIVLKDLKTQHYWSGLARTQVCMNRLSEKRIRGYFEKVTPWDKAGAYAIQEGPRIVKSICGSYTNVVGLSVELLTLMFREAKIKSRRG